MNATQPNSPFASHRAVGAEPQTRSGAESASSPVGGTFDLSGVELDSVEWDLPFATVLLTDGTEFPVLVDEDLSGRGARFISFDMRSADTRAAAWVRANKDALIAEYDARDGGL